MVYLCFFIFLVQWKTGNAQSFTKIFSENPGVQVGMQQGYTDVNDQGLNYQFRLYNRHNFSSGRFGEISLSSGFISGLGYRSQLTPLAYRVAQPVFGEDNPLYAYAGLGVFYNRPLEVIAPDDPLTVEMGRGLPTSSFWDFEGGFAPFIPFGLGLNVPLELGTDLNITAGYNQTLSAFKFNDREVPKGFWGISIGLNFNRAKKDYTPTPLFISTVRDAEIPSKNWVQPLKIADIKEPNISAILLKGLNQRSINFDVLSSDIQVQDQNWLEETSLIISLNPGNQIHIKGYASATGSNQVNEMISESRSRAVWLALAESGIELQSIAYSWYGDNNPVSENDTDQGRYQNQRVEFEIRSLDEAEAPVGQLESSGEALSVEINKPVADTDDVQFDWLRLTGDNTEQIFNLVIELMANRPELQVFVGSVSNESWASLRLRREFDKARSDKLTALLVERGVDPTRILTHNPYQSEIPETFRPFLQQGLDQQTLIIPFNPSENEE